MKTMTALVLMICFILCGAGSAAVRKVHTVAGAYLGDGKPATSASLASPQYAAMDSRGNLYITDASHCRIRKVSRLGVISTAVGTGICGFSGDGGPAKQAQILGPAGIAVDSHDNIFVIDKDNLRVRMINSAKIITTVAGNGSFGFCGDGGPAVQACLGILTAIAIGEDGNGEFFYFADIIFQRVRRVNVATGVITTVAGNGQTGAGGDGGPAILAQLAAPEGLAVDTPSHSLWISDTATNRIRRVDTNTGIITTFFGAQCDSTLCSPLGISVDPAGNLYVPDRFNGHVLEVQYPSGVATLKAGSGVPGYSGDGGPATSARLAPQDAIVDHNGNLLIVDAANDRVRKVDASNTISTIVGGYIGDGGKSVQSSVSVVGGLAFDQSGNLYVSDSLNHRIRMISPAGTISTVAGTGISVYSGDGGPATQAGLDTSTGLAIDPFGNIYLADIANLVIRKISGGTITKFADNVFANALAVDSSGNVYAADVCVIRKFTPAGESSIVAGIDHQCGYNGDGIPATQANISSPGGLAVDASGNLYFSDEGNRRLRVVNSQGIVDTVAGDGFCSHNGDGGPAKQAELCGATDIAIDSKSNLYINDSFRIRVIDASGTIKLYAGTGAGGGTTAMDCLRWVRTWLRRRWLLVPEARSTMGTILRIG